MPRGTQTRIPFAMSLENLISWRRCARNVCSDSLVGSRFSIQGTFRNEHLPGNCVQHCYVYQEADHVYSSRKLSNPLKPPNHVTGHIHQLKHTRRKQIDLRLPKQTRSDLVLFSDVPSFLPSSVIQAGDFSSTQGHSERPSRRSFPWT